MREIGITRKTDFQGDITYILEIGLKDFSLSQIEYATLLQKQIKIDNLIQTKPFEKCYHV